NKKTLRKIKETPPQSTLTESERRRNLKGAFGIFTEDFAGKSVLLVDDVMTTGSSIEEACKTIITNGEAKSAHAIVFAAT
ncbi:ComF family protein, partial [Treponema sp. R6D11]